MGFGFDFYVGVVRTWVLLIPDSSQLAYTGVVVVIGDLSGVVDGTVVVDLALFSFFSKDNQHGHNSVVFYAVAN